MDSVRDGEESHCVTRMKESEAHGTPGEPGGVVRFNIETTSYSSLT